MKRIRKKKKEKIDPLGNLITKGLQKTKKPITETTNIRKDLIKMAKYNISNNHTSKRALILGDCSEGDIVSIPAENIVIGIVSDGEPFDRGEMCVVDLSDGRTYIIQMSTACRRYTGIVQFDRNDFEEFCE